MARDRVLVRAASKYWVIKRNLDRVPPGSEVEIFPCGMQLAGSYGKFKEEKTDWGLRSKSGFVIATSTDLEDFAILITEHEWYAHGPEELLTSIDAVVKMLGDN